MFLRTGRAKREDGWFVSTLVPKIIRNVKKKRNWGEPYLSRSGSRGQRGVAGVLDVEQLERPCARVVF